MNILLIEDNSDLGESFAAALRGEGHVVEWRNQASGQNELEDKFDLVIDTHANGAAIQGAPNALAELPPWVRTVLQAARQQVQSTNEALEYAERVSAYRKQLVAHLSHELKTPISAILTTSQSMLNHERTSDKYKQALRLCERNSRSMSQLIRRMLDLAKAGSDAWEPCLKEIDPRELLTASIDLHTPLAQDNGVEILLVCPEGHRVESDVDLMLIMVNNLLGNAIRYTPRDKSIIVRFAPQNADRGAAISVIDEGPGIRPDVLPHIFDAFYQDDQSRGQKHAHSSNYGLGLALTAELATRLQVEIKVDSTPGNGSAFHLLLPAID